MPEVLSPDTKPISPKTADDVNDLFKSLDIEETEVKEPVKKQAKPEKEEPEETKEDDDELDGSSGGELDDGIYKEEALETSDAQATEDVNTKDGNNDDIKYVTIVE